MYNGVMILRLTKRVGVAVTVVFSLLLAGRGEANSPRDDPPPANWTEGHIVKQNGFTVSFTFPDSGYALDHHEEFVNKCMESIQDDGKLIGVTALPDTLHVQFLRSRQEMKEATSYAVAGFTNSQIKTLFIVASGDSNEVKPPIRHELMHLIAMISWGHPTGSSTWMNEGLAAFAENNCNGYTVAEIYRYFMKAKMLIPIDSLTTDFYRQPEMIAYHQSAFMVQSLLERFGAKKLKQLWVEGFDKFNNIYGQSFASFQSAIEKNLLDSIPAAPPIDWETFKTGCK